MPEPPIVCMRRLTIARLAWGVTLTLHAAAHDYAGLMVLRALLGVFECGMGPGFTLITGMWYTPKEHSLRHCVWFAGNASASIIGAMIAYGVLHYHGTYPQWKACTIPSACAFYHCSN